MVAQVTTLKVDYQFQGGCHIFTAEKMSGLYVCHQDPEVAFNAVAPSIKTILKYQYRDCGLDFTVMHVSTFEEFCRNNGINQEVPAYSDREFVIQKIAA